MLKLYYAPGACSLAPHIVLREADLPFELERVDLGEHTTEHGEDFLAINPKGQVPVLRLTEGEHLTECAVISQYLADASGSPELLPRRNLERYRVMEWQSYVGAELHKSFGPLFNSAYPDAARSFSHALLRRKYEWLDGRIPATGYLLGSIFTIADAYLFTITRWAGPTGLDLSSQVRLQSYMRRVASRPAVHAALRAEGLAE